MQDCPHPPPKTARVGEVGWGVPKLSDQTVLKSGHQIMVNFLLLIPWIFFWQGYMYHWSAFVFYHCTFSSTSCDSTHVHCVVERVPPGCWGPAYPSLPNPLLPTPRGTAKDTTHQYSSTAGKRSVIVQPEQAMVNGPVNMLFEVTSAISYAECQHCEFN